MPNKVCSSCLMKDLEILGLQSEIDSLNNIIDNVCKNNTSLYDEVKKYRLHADIQILNRTVCPHHSTEN